MTSASKVGHIFTQAGSAYSKIGDMVMRLHPAAQEINAIEEKQILHQNRVQTIGVPNQHQVVLGIPSNPMQQPSANQQPNHFSPMPTNH